MHHLLQDIGIAILVATVVGLIFHYLKQPIILGYLVSGIIIGPTIGPRWVTDPDHIEVISELGLIFLLFIIGLEMDVQKLRKSGKAMIVAGVGQFSLSVLIGLGFFVLIGYKVGGGSLDALYLAIFCGLSSTAIVVKTLYDKYELDTFSGRITLGILIFQDIWAILVLALLPHFTDPKISVVALAVVKGLGLAATAFIVSSYLLKRLFEKVSKTPEIVVSISIAWCAALAGAAELLGLSMEMGALIAGVAISSFPYSEHISAKILPLRDFFLTLFFISLGMKIPEPSMALLTGALVIVLFVIASRFLIVYPLLAMNNTGRHTAFISSLNLSQISEFSLVIATLGVSFGHIRQELMSLILYAMSVTSVLSAYMIKANHKFYRLFDNSLVKLGFPELERPATEVSEESAGAVVILGYHRGAAALIKEFQREQPEVLSRLLVIDFNSEILKMLHNKGIKGMFGDLSSLDTLVHAKIASAEMIISTIPDMLLKGTSNRILVRACRALAPNAVIVATAESSAQVQELMEEGATYVIRPYSMIGREVADYVYEHLR